MITNVWPGVPLSKPPPLQTGPPLPPNGYQPWQFSGQPVPATAYSSSLRRAGTSQFLPLNRLLLFQPPPSRNKEGTHQISAGAPSQPVEKQSPESRGSHAEAEPRFSARLPLSSRDDVSYLLTERDTIPPRPVVASKGRQKLPRAGTAPHTRPAAGSTAPAASSPARARMRCGEPPRRRALKGPMAAVPHLWHCVPPVTLPGCRRRRGAPSSPAPSDVEACAAGLPGRAWARTPLRGLG